MAKHNFGMLSETSRSSAMSKQLIKTIKPMVHNEFQVAKEQDIRNGNPTLASSYHGDP